MPSEFPELILQNKEQTIPALKNFGEQLEIQIDANLIQQRTSLI